MDGRTDGTNSITSVAEEGGNDALDDLSMYPQLSVTSSISGLIRAREVQGTQVQSDCDTPDYYPINPCKSDTENIITLLAASLWSYIDNSICIKVQSQIQEELFRAWPLMIWGGRRKYWTRIFFFLVDAFSKKFFPRPFEIYFFFQEGLLKFFSLEKGLQIFFFSIFSAPPQSGLNQPKSKRFVSLRDS